MRSVIRSMPLLLRRKALVIIATAEFYAACACTIVAVGKDASASGFPMVCHSEDSGPRTNDIRLVRVPRKYWPEGSMRPLYMVSPGYPRLIDAQRASDYAPVNGQQSMAPLAQIPQVTMTYAYWDLDYGLQNEKGLSIGESTCTAMTVGWPNSLPYGYNAASIHELSKLALERCDTGRCAVELMGKIAVELGFYSEDSGDPANPAYAGSAECLTIGDASGEIWNFNVMTGRNNASAIWAAQRMPHDHVIAVANAFTIRKLDLSDPENSLYSPGVTKLAEEMGWWKPEDAADPNIFPFFYAYGYTPGVFGEALFPPNLADKLAHYSGRRMWRIFSKLSPEEGSKLDSTKGNLPRTENPFPSSVPAPRGSVTLKMVMDLYRDHYEGTPYDLTKGMAAGPYGNPNRLDLAIPAPPIVGLWERAMSMYRATWSFINVIRPGDRSLVWFGYDAPHGTVYVPFYGASPIGAPEGYHSHEGTLSKFSWNVSYFPFMIANAFSTTNFKVINAEIRKKAEAVELEAQNLVAVWEAEDGVTMDMLAKQSNAFAVKTVANWWEFVFRLFTKYSRMVETIDDSEKGTNPAAYQPPDWWLQSRDVGFMTWTPQGPYHGVPDLDVARLAAMPSRMEKWTISLCAAGVAIALMGAYQAGLRHGLRERRKLGGKLNSLLAQP